MARPIDSVKDIHESKDLWKIAVSCKHIWSVTSSSNKEHIEMILVDSKVRDMIQAIVPTYLVSKFKSELAAGSSYIMQNFKVLKNDFSFKSTNHSYKLVLCGSTSVKKTDLPDIPAYYLNLLGLDAIVEGMFQSNVLVDILGGITEFSQSQINGDNNNKVVFTIVDTTYAKFHSNLLYNVRFGVNVRYNFMNHKNNKEDSNIVIVLINARVKEAQGGFPVSVSNTWNRTKLLINDLHFDEVKKLKESLGNDLALLSMSSLQVEATQNSYYSDFDKFLWKAEIMSLSKIANLQHETTCVIVATLDKFEAGQMGWFYDGCVECTRSVALKDGKLQCYEKHLSSEPVPRYKLEVLAVDGNSKAKFIFWDTDCVKLIGMSALQMKMDLIEVGNVIYSDVMYVCLKNDEDYRKKIKDSFKGDEHTSKLETPDPLSQDDISVVLNPYPSSGNSGLTPSKRYLTDVVEGVDSVQQSSTKLTKDVKKEK
ncbi:uncharacterized protein LOC131596764 [Vicia villosa]|uniref:uncharacterized protein LOC131596764 n=1 Tax=Vicia villosa TaxID=3911 RepID=UPI00273C529F|nr:uncharacterized protein LOC131596764 [Vicia villosa]